MRCATPEIRGIAAGPSIVDPRTVRRPNEPPPGLSGLLHDFVAARPHGLGPGALPGRAREYWSSVSPVARGERPRRPAGNTPCHAPADRTLADF